MPETTNRPIACGPNRAMAVSQEGSLPLLAMLAIVVALLMFVVPLAISFPLLDPDEGLHAAIAQEMVEQGNWITPHFIGRPFLDKPIFYFWAQALSLKLLGDNPAAVRLPGLMFGLLGAATTGLLAWRMFDPRTGLIAATLYATTILPTALAQAAAHDVALVPWVNGALLCLWESRHVAGRRAFLLGVAGAGGFLGLSLLTKGLLGITVVGLAFGSYLLATRQLSWRMVAAGVAVPVIAVAIAAPWYVAVDVQNPGFLRYYFLDRHLLGFATDTQPHSNQPWWYYLPILAGGGLPWIGYLPILAEDGVRKRTARAKNAGGKEKAPADTAMLWCWLLGWMVFITAAQSKLVTYLWPAFPPITILAAATWTRRIDNTLSDGARLSFSRTFVVSSWSGPVVLPAAVLILQWFLGLSFGWGVWVAVGLAAAAAVTPLLFWRREHWELSLVAASLSVAAQFLVVMAFVVPVAAERYSARDLAQHFNRCGALPARLFVVEERVGSVVFYLDPRLRAGLKQEQIKPLTANKPVGLRKGDLIAVPDHRLAEARQYLDLCDAHYELAGRYRLYRIAEP